MAIPLNDNLSLTHDDDDGFIVDDTLVRGGYTSVNVYSDLLKLAPKSLKVGMVVYVINEDSEYRLTSSTPNTWTKVNVLSSGIPKGSIIDSSKLLGNTSAEVSSFITDKELSKVDFNYLGDYNLEVINIELSPLEKQFIGIGSVVCGRGGSIGAAESEVLGIMSTTISSVDSTKLIVHSATSGKRNAETFSGQLKIKASPLISRTPSSLVTKKGLEVLAVTKAGGEVNGPLHNVSNLGSVLSGTINNVSTDSILGITTITLNTVSESDKTKMFDTMMFDIFDKTNNSVIQANLTSLRIIPAGNGFIIKDTVNASALLGRSIKVKSNVIMPTSNTQLATKQYVDDLHNTLHLDIPISPVNPYTRTLNVIDPLDGKTKVKYSYETPCFFSNSRGEPTAVIYRTIDGIKYQVTQTNVRLGFVERNDVLHIVVEFWDIAPFAIDVHLK